MSQLCPCHSQQNYISCCLPFHKGKNPENALQLMRSRYSAYALQLLDYIINTTHPKHIEYQHNYNDWKKQILKAYVGVQFKELEILSFIEEGDCATVTFVAHLYKDNQDISFTEKSTFEKKEGRWLYLLGEFV